MARYKLGEIKTASQNQQSKLSELRSAAEGCKEKEDKEDWTAEETETEEVPPYRSKPELGCQDGKRKVVWKGDHYECGECKDGFIETSSGCAYPAEMAKNVDCPVPGMRKEFEPVSGMVACFCTGNTRWDGAGCVAKVAEKTPTMDPHLPAWLIPIIGSAISRHGRDRHKGGHKPQTPQKRSGPKKHRKYRMDECRKLPSGEIRCGK